MKITTLKKTFRNEQLISLNCFFSKHVKCSYITIYLLTCYQNFITYFLVIIIIMFSLKIHSHRKHLTYLFCTRLWLEFLSDAKLSVNYIKGWVSDAEYHKLPTIYFGWIENFKCSLLISKFIQGEQKTTYVSKKKISETKQIIFWYIC